MVRTHDPNGLRMNSRRADEAAAGQAAQHQQAVQENQAARKVIERQAAPVVSGPTAMAQDNAQLTSPQPQQPGQGGFIAQTREARLDANNATPEQRAQNQQNLQGIMNAPLGNRRTTGSQIEELRNANPANAGADQANRSKLTSLMQQQQLEQDGEKKKADESAAASAAAQQNPQQGGMAALLGNLPPEAAHLAGPFQEILNAITQGQQENAASTQALLNGGVIDVNGQPVEVQGINQTYDAMEQKIKDMESGYVKMQEGIQGMLDKAKEQQDKYITEAEKAQKDRLAWQEHDMLRQASKEKQKAIDTRIAKLALTGGFGSDGGLREIEETRMAYESRMDDIKTEFGIQRTELAAKFTGLYLEASNEHLTKSIGNIKETAAALERIAGQSLSTKQARMAAENTVLTKFLDTQTASRKELASTYLGIADKIQETVNQERNFKRLDADKAWEQFKWLKSTYGTNMPEGALEGIKQKLPGIDVEALAAAPTAAEIEKARRSRVGGSVVSFLPSEMKSNGTPLSFDEYVRQKEAEAVAAGAMRFDTSPQAMAKYKAEYEAKLSAAKAYDPVSLNIRLQDRIKNLPKNVRENAVQNVSKLLQEGKYADASYFVDGLGTPLSATERGDYIQALNAKQNIERIDQIIDELGQQGPVIGRVREKNPYDDKIVELDNLITQTVPGLARGIFKEVGVLTDSDIERYKSTIANPKLTADQAKTATRNLLQTINNSLQNQLAVHGDSGLNIRDVRLRFERGQASSAPAQSTTAAPRSAVSSYLRSQGY